MRSEALHRSTAVHMERMAILFIMLSLNAEAMILKWLASEFPTDILWIDEMQHHKETGARFPLPTLEKVWAKSNCLDKLGATWIEHMRRNYVVFSDNPNDDDAPIICIEVHGDYTVHSQGTLHPALGTSKMTAHDAAITEDMINGLVIMADSGDAAVITHIDVAKQEITIKPELETSGGAYELHYGGSVVGQFALALVMWLGATNLPPERIPKEFVEMAESTRHAATDTPTMMMQTAFSI